MGLLGCSQGSGEVPPEVDLSAATQCGSAYSATGARASTDDGNGPDNAIDGNPSTRWSGYGRGANLTVDLGSARAWCGVGIAWYEGKTRRSAFTLSASDDGSNFHEVLSANSSGATSSSELSVTPGAQGRYLRITVNGNTKNDWASILEVTVLGPLATADGGTPLDAGTPMDGGAPGDGKLDSDGVTLLFPSAPGAHWNLGTQDPNSAPGLEIEKGVNASAHTEQGVKFWNIVSYALDYSSGGSGVTSRLHMHASGGSQRYTWKNTPGYLANTEDVRNQEMTAYIRPHKFTDLSRTQVTLKVRGGRHTPISGDLASCVMMTYGPAAAGSSRIVRFGKELEHPNYDYVSLSSRVPGSLTDGQWVGLKMVSYQPRGDSKRVVNRLYVDAAPFDAQGRPGNHWQLASEYVDVEGVSTGRYNKLANWGGWQTTFRGDGIHDLDFAILSVREISPP